MDDEFAGAKKGTSGQPVARRAEAEQSLKNRQPAEEDMLEQRPECWPGHYYD